MGDKIESLPQPIHHFPLGACDISFNDKQKQHKSLGYQTSESNYQDAQQVAGQRKGKVHSSRDYEQVQAVVKNNTTFCKYRKKNPKCVSHWKAIKMGMLQLFHVMVGV